MCIIFMYSYHDQESLLSSIDLFLCFTFSSVLINVKFQYTLMSSQTSALLLSFLIFRMVLVIFAGFFSKKLLVSIFLSEIRHLNWDGFENCIFTKMNFFVLQSYMFVW